MRTNESKKPSVVALGMFDGVHMGHRALLRQAKTIAKEMEAEPVALSFFEHPQSLFEQAPPSLTLADERIDIIRSLGVTPHLEHFDAAFAALSPEDYIRWLQQTFSAQVLVVGYNHRFGYQAKGDVDMMHKICQPVGIQVAVVEPQCYLGEAVSSSRIRSSLEKAEIPDANTMLEQPYFFRGKVVHGRAIGRTIGFPTLNLFPGEKAVPQEGVYAGELRFGRSLDTWTDALPAVVSVGKNPTVNDEKNPAGLVIESHVLQDIGSRYDEDIVLRIYHHMRGETRFASLEELKKQIAIDCATAEEMLPQWRPDWAKDNS